MNAMDNILFELRETARFCKDPVLCLNLRSTCGCPSGVHSSPGSEALYRSRTALQWGVGCRCQAAEDGVYEWR
jgi:hypothetical protein